MSEQMRHLWIKVKDVYMYICRLLRKTSCIHLYPQTNVRIFALHALHACLRMIHNIAYCFTDLLFPFIYILCATVRHSTICIRSFVFATIATLKGLFTFLTSVIFIRYHLAHRDDNKQNKFGCVINYGCNNVSEGPDTPR